MGITLCDVTYTDDDVSCRQLLGAVGICARPTDTIRPIQEAPDIVITQKAGGGGRVREFIDQYLLGSR